jgi:hypothetical protein
MEALVLRLEEPTMDRVKPIDHLSITEEVAAGPASARSRRSVLAAAAGAAGALVGHSLVHPDPVSAAGVVLGGVNSASSATTIQNTLASASAKALIGQVTTSIVGSDTAGVQGISNAKGGMGVFGVANNGVGRGLFGHSNGGVGVYGESTATTGSTRGVRGVSASTSGIGVFGTASATSGATTGVLGSNASSAGFGVQGKNSATNGTGVIGVADSGTGAVGVRGRSATGMGVVGEAPGDVGETYGVYGIASAYPRFGGHGYGVYGVGISGGVFGRSPFGAGVEGQSDSWAGVYGNSWTGVVGQGIDAGVRGQATAMNIATKGVYGEAASTTGVGVWGKGNTGLDGEGVATGIYASGAVAVNAVGTQQGVLASGTTYGVNATGGTTGVGVRGAAGTGVSAEGTAVGLTASGSDYGVKGSSDTTGVHGTGESYGVVGEAGSTRGALAGWFAGNVEVTGDFSVSGNKLFVIDHPTDPANRTLTHACIEAPEVLNLYRGAVILDKRGFATVRLPGYFADLNTNYGYQLTPMGAPAPTLHIARKIQGNSFRIGGGEPGQEVCWQVTGVRNDAWVRRHPIRVEQRKRGADRGRYLNPELYGEPRNAALRRLPTAPKLPKVPKAPAAPRASRLSELPEMRRPRRRRRGTGIAFSGST